MLDDLECQHDVELCAAFGQRLGGALAIVDGEVLARSMHGRGRDVTGRGVHAGDRRAEPGHRLADQTAATADVEQRQSRQRFAVQGVALPVRSHPVADVGDPHRVQPVQRRELAGGIPPFVRDAGEAFDFGRIDRSGSGDMRGFDHGYP